jgi:hypothetical protein
MKIFATVKILYPLAFGFIVTIPVWLWFIAPQITKLPRDFYYEAKIFSQDNFYDEEKQEFGKKINSNTNFYYQAVSEKNGVYEIKNVFDVKTPDGEPIFSAERLYGIDPVTSAHVKEFGDKDRSGYLFAPKGLRKDDKFTYWHINYDGPARMVFAEEEVILGLPVYRYESWYEGIDIDQTERLGHLPGVGITRGINLDPHLQLWIEPVSGHLVKYEDISTAYYYDLATGERLYPWNRFNNQYTNETIILQVSTAQNLKWKIIAVMRIIPLLLGICAVLLIFATMRKNKRVGHL